MNPLLVVSDLDGTLLNEDYSFAEAVPALTELQKRGIPLVFNTSKTASECVYWQQQLGVPGPFICENGAAIGHWDGRLQVEQEFAPPRSEVLAALQVLRGEGFQFFGFSDCRLQQLASMTGLPLAQARLAAQRQYSEPLSLRAGAARQRAFRERLADFGLVATQGGRFLTVSGDVDKGRAMPVLSNHYGPVTLVVVGDSPNDLSMLRRADIALLIRSRHTEKMLTELQGPAAEPTQKQRPAQGELQLSEPRMIVHSEATGSEGWAQVMMNLLEGV